MIIVGSSVQVKWKDRDVEVPFKFPCRWQSGQEAGCLTPWTYALSPKIAQNRKVIGAWHSIGQLQKDKEKGGDEKTHKILDIYKHKNKTWRC